MEILEESKCTDTKILNMSCEKSLKREVKININFIKTKINVKKNCDVKYFLKF